MPTLSSADHEAIAGKVAEQIFLRDQLHHPRCNCPVGNERHDKHHQLIDELIDFFDRFKSLRWGVARAVLTILVVSLLGMAGLGMVLTAATDATAALVGEYYRQKRQSLEASL
jgi:hypothetical protein